MIRPERYADTNEYKIQSMKNTFIILGALLIVAACTDRTTDPDAYGNFFSDEYLISAEASGKVLDKYVQEGEEVSKGELAYQLDTIQPYLKLQEVKAKRNVLRAQRSSVVAQLEVLEVRIKAAKQDLERFERMHTTGAVADKQLDDLRNQLEVLEKQQRQVKTNFQSLEAEEEAVEAGLASANDMLARTRITAPVAGNIIETYAEPGELVAAGKPLFKLVNLQSLEVKAYFSGGQLPLIKLGDAVEVLVDNGTGGLKSYEGQIIWISPEAEFTPKIIQTREERVNLVYAVKIRVANDGFLKLNMPAEVILKQRD